MEKLFYSISEVAETLGENISLVRFWSNSFPKLVKPVRNAKGNRQFTASDLESLKQIHFLVKDKGLTLDGAYKKLLEERSGVDKTVRALDALKNVRQQLVEIRKTL